MTTEQILLKTALVTEVFSTIQGEGKSIGTPSIFVRFWGCNLRCRFNGVECDTPYAVYKERDKAKVKTTKEVAQSIHELTPTHIVFTGGEPLLYQDFIIQLMKNFLIKDNYTAEIETNGSIAVKPELSKLINQFNVSVKLFGSNQEDGYESKRINHLALKSFDNKKSYFKFVVSSENDIREILELKHTYNDWEVYLMPEGMYREDIIKHSEQVVEWCLKYNYKFSPREHIIIWNYKRGK